MELTGNIVALVTPFRNGEVDTDALTKLCTRAIAGGVSGVVPCGTTGESPALTHEEHDRIVDCVIAAGQGRVPVIAGIGDNNTARAVQAARKAQRAGAAAVLAVAPYYNKPNQQGLLRHYRQIADATDLPVVLYDIPGRCGVQLDLDTLAELSEHPNIAAIKEATGNVDRVTPIRAATSLSVLSGDDALTLPLLALGGAGVISVVSNLLPHRMTRLVNAALQGEMSLAREEHEQLFPVMRATFVDTNPIPVKEALAMYGWLEPEFRLPLCRLAEPERTTLHNALLPFAEELRG